jgi:adenosylcobalamin-dependent ribonucleoside-triphosphate reductase
MPDGTNETWADTVRRVVEGTYEIQRRHAEKFGVDWDEDKAQESAKEMYARIFDFKFTPPGRGLWMMGTDYVLERNNGSPLNNCAFISTREVKDKHSVYPFTFLMDMSMLGVGVGFDTEGAGAYIPGPTREMYYFQVPDSREGWVESVRLLLEAYIKGTDLPIFDYSLIRPEGAPIKGFGGTSSGPAPLIKLHERINEVLGKASLVHRLSSRDIVDIQNMIGACVVAGNVRRSAEIALGRVGDEEFLDLKNFEKNPERGEWAWASNNSVIVNQFDRPDYEAIAQRIADNGEPGLFYLDVARKYGRMGDAPDNKDKRAAGTNPCAEQILESGELCTLVEVYPSRHTDIVDFLRTLKFAYLYAKTVTLVPTHDDNTNEIMSRNRRIGTSISGVVQFIHRNGKDILEQWLLAGYGYIENLDRKYSRWLDVPESIRKTSVKPSGSVSLLAGATPGVHYPVADFYIRRIRLQKGSPLVDKLSQAGYKVEPDFYSDNTMVVEMPVKGEGLPSEKEVSIFDKADIATFMAKVWSDNAVSCTITFQEHEKGMIETVLRNNEGKWKTVSFLPVSTAAYAQMPYEEITEEQYYEMIKDVKEVDLTGQGDGVMEKYCDTDVCEIKFTPSGIEVITT